MPTVFMDNLRQLSKLQPPYSPEIIANADFTIATSPTEVLQRLSQYGLKATEIMGEYTVNAQILTELTQSAEIEATDLATVNLLQAWPKQLNWVQFNQLVEQFQYAWLNDYQLGLNLEAAFTLARCLILSPSNCDEKSAQLKFQCFLMHTLSRVTHAFDQHQTHFIQHFDVDTHLPNQQLLLNTLQDYSTSNQESSTPEIPALGILMINLNIDFEDASHMGEHLSTMSADIVQAAVQVIQENLNKEAYLYRASTQELVVVVHQLKFSAQLQLIAARLAHAFEEELPLNNITLILKPFFGGVSSLKTAVSPLSLLDSAKMALHQAIVNNQQIEIYDQLITSASLNQHQLDEDIIKALQQNELDLYLQPVVNLKLVGEPETSPFGEYCVSGEFLLRWPNAQRGFVSPVRLIDTIYKKGFGKIFVRWLINTACRRCAELMNSHQRRFSFNINLSSNDLLDEDLPELLPQSIALWNTPAQNIVIEITETDLLVNEEKVMKVLDEIVNLGFKIALDDFGTGYSSMARLRNMPVHLIKIDQSFVRHLAESKEDKAIVQSILKLSHSLGKEVIAEGVEDEASMQILKNMQCDKIQGYYYAKPMPFDDFMPWLAQFEAARGG
ncbi:MAG TPA: EAL domain-containing protein [Methylotenera sp.]|nr:EAL domain-containing protein [Methylotenera sp.]HPH04490.1 EAL domain-containing protein [Methylotenera sp.]HPN00895.1 EAL domain-containing protein [Methylotenera sp.]